MQKWVDGRVTISLKEYDVLTDYQREAIDEVNRLRAQVEVKR